MLAAAGAASLSACRFRDAILPPPLPRDRAAVFHAFIAGEPFVPLGTPDSPWQVLAEPPSAVNAGPGSLTVSSVPGRRAWTSPRLPLAPLGGAPPGQVEELTWEASVTLDERYFIVCELRFAGEPGAILLQVTPFDLQVFQDAERPGGGTSDSVPRRLGDGQPHFWRLRLAEERCDLRLDGSSVWTLDGRRGLSRVAFGETRTDALHGGSLVLRDLVYVRRPVE
jgi:hypothetical protein